MDTKSGDDNKSDMLGRHGDLTAAFKSSYAKHSTAFDNTQQHAAGVGLGTDVDSGFSTSDSGVGYESTSDEGSDTSGYGKGIAGELPIVTRSGGDSGDGGGKAIA